MPAMTVGWLKQMLATHFDDDTVVCIQSPTDGGVYPATGFSPAALEGGKSAIVLGPEAEDPRIEIRWTGVPKGGSQPRRRP